MSFMPPQQGPPGGPPPGAPAGLPPELLAALAGGGGPPGGPPQNGGGGPDPLEALQTVIQDLHSLVAVLPDPQDTATATQCLGALTKIQSGMMAAQKGAGDAHGALMQRLGGA